MNTSCHQFEYDNLGGNIIAEVIASGINYFTWVNGETLTASLDGETVFYCHDANKNVTDLVNDTGDVVAHYEYSPFGVITTDPTGTLSADNPFRFSSEYFDSTTGLVEYKYRKYNPALGKFLSRDPIEEQGGLNLYAICNNDLINHWDEWGLKVFVIERNLGGIMSRDGISLLPWMLNGAFEFFLGPVEARLLEATATYYLNNTKHCILVVADKCSPSLNEKGKLVDFTGVDPLDTWDFQAKSSYNNPASDWLKGSFNASAYKRATVRTLVDNDSKDDDVKETARAYKNYQTKPYDAGGENRYNCCDWVEEVMLYTGINYENSNPRPFGDNPPPWWVQEDLVKYFVDKF